jgi:lysophospholipase L1-like esterase
LGLALGIAAVTGAVSGSASAQGCDRIDQLVTTTPAPPHDLTAWRAYAEESELASRNHIDLVLAGDSLAQAWDTKMWRPLRVLNLGVGGDRTQHVLWRLRLAKWSKLRPAKALVMLGTNNLAAGDEPCAITTGLMKVIARIRRIWPMAEIGFLDIPPRGEKFLFRNDARMAINSALSHLRGVKSINVDDTMTCDWKQPCANYANDNLHFSEIGYRVLLKAVKTALFEK